MLRFLSSDKVRATFQEKDKKNGIKMFREKFAILYNVI